jgi:hypothetical protein
MAVVGFVLDIGSDTVHVLPASGNDSGKDCRGNDGDGVEAFALLLGGTGGESAGCLGDSEMNSNTMKERMLGSTVDCNGILDTMTYRLMITLLANIFSL